MIETVRSFFCFVALLSVIVFELCLYGSHFYLFTMYILGIGELCFG